MGEKVVVDRYRSLVLRMVEKADGKRWSTRANELSLR